ncbi:hypothetical protein FF1_041857 [Malus domestica]
MKLCLQQCPGLGPQQWGLFDSELRPALELDKHKQSSLISALLGLSSSTPNSNATSLNQRTKTCYLRHHSLFGLLAPISLPTPVETLKLKEEGNMQIKAAV